MDNVSSSLKTQKMQQKKFKKLSMTAMMNLSRMQAKLLSGFTARLAIAKYIRTGSSNTPVLEG